MRFTLEEIARATGGSAFGVPVAVDGATQDSRGVGDGMLFVPLVAERDGHDFIAAALDGGAVAYLTHQQAGPGSGVLVDDTGQALLDLARTARSRIAGPVVGVTGSVGKTSTKDLLAGALGTTFRTHASAKSFNNEIGVPLTLINAPDNVDAAVIEMGSRGIGHIATLCEIASPTIGVITTVAAVHTGEFGTIDNVAIAKGELVEALPEDGLAVLNADVPLVEQMRDRTSAEVLTFGANDAADVRFSDVEVDAELRVRFRLDSPWGRLDVSPATRGAHLVPNAAAAAAVALWLGTPPELVASGLERAEMSPWRMELLPTRSGATIINDTYNANPTSMKGAIDSLKAMPGIRKIAVLGYMGELGDDERALHIEIARYARDRGIEVLSVGTELYGVEPASDPIVAIGILERGDAVLVKGSRSAGLETVAAALADA